MPSRRIGFGSNMRTKSIFVAARAVAFNAKKAMKMARRHRLQPQCPMMAQSRQPLKTIVLAHVLRCAAIFTSVR
jgi:hypothetical protein